MDRSARAAPGVSKTRTAGVCLFAVFLRLVRVSNHIHLCLHNPMAYMHLKIQCNRISSTDGCSVSRWSKDCRVKASWAKWDEQRTFDCEGNVKHTIWLITSQNSPTVPHRAADACSYWQCGGCTLFQPNVRSTRGDFSLSSKPSLRVSQMRSPAPFEPKLSTCQARLMETWVMRDCFLMSGALPLCTGIGQRTVVQRRAGEEFGRQSSGTALRMGGVRVHQTWINLDWAFPTQTRKPQDAIEYVKGKLGV